MTRDDEPGSGRFRPRCGQPPREAADPRHSTGEGGPRHPKAPVPKQRTPGPYRVPLRERRNGLVILNSGKGKTTAALGTLHRGAGATTSDTLLKLRTGTSPW